jgi:hypothetical protein
MLKCKRHSFSEDDAVSVRLKQQFAKNLLGFDRAVGGVCKMKTRNKRMVSVLNHEECIMTGRKTIHFGLT